MMLPVAKRYAEALVELSFQEDAIELFQQELRTIGDLFDKRRDFRCFLLDPGIKAAAKKEVIRKLFAGKMKVELVNFLLLLIDKRRVGFLPLILNKFDELAERKKNVLEMTIVSAAPLEESQINDLKNRCVRIHKAYSSKVKVRIDKKLIGGIKVIIGDNVMDGSIRGRLEGLRETLMNQIC